MTHPIVIDVIGRDRSAQAMKSAADSQVKLAKNIDATNKSMGKAGDASVNLRKSQLGLIAAQERYNKVAKDSGASVGKLASAQKGLITAQQQVAKATNNAAQATQDASEKHSAVAGKMKLVAAAAGALVAVKLTGFLRDAVGAASDLNETQSKAKAIFGENSKAINDWASNAATKLGLSRQAAIDAAAGFGDMFRQLGFTAQGSVTMSKQVVQLATDLGSFNNLPTATVLEMIAGGFRGEYDSLQRVIPNISAARVQQEALNETHKRSVNDLTAAEKATATLTIIQQDGARAQGDFARTSSGMANQTKIASARFEDLKAKIGQDLLPVINKLLGFASGLLDVFTRYSDVLVPLVGILGGVALAVWAVVKASKAWTEVQILLNSSFISRFAPGLVGILPPLALAAAAFYGMYKVAGLLTNAISGTDEAMVKAAGRGAKDLAKALQDSGGAFDASAQKTLATTLVTGGYVDKAAKAHITVEQLTAGVTGNDEAMQSLVETWRASGKPSEVTIGTLRRLHEQFQENTASGSQTADTTNKVADAMKQITGAVPLTALQQQDQFLKENNLTLDEAKKKYTDAVTQAHSFTAELGYMQNALQTLSGNTITATQQQIAITDALGNEQNHWAGARAQVEAHGHSLDLNTESGRANTKWATDQLLAIEQQAVSYAQSTGSIKKGTDQLGINTEALKVSMRQAGFTDQQIRTLIATYGATPESVTTSVKQQGAEAVLTALGDIAFQLHAIADPVWKANLDIAAGANAAQGGQAKATGGYIAGPGGPTSDVIPIMASNGEFMVNARSTAKHRALLENINRNKYAAGGLVGDLNVAITPPKVPDIRALYNQAAGALFGGAGGPATVGGNLGAWIAAALAVTGTSADWAGAIQRRIMFESGGNPNAINNWDSNAMAGDPSRGLMQTIGCVTLDSVILTQRGWLKHDQVIAGDTTIGYNPATGMSEWTPITAVHHYEDAEVWRIGNHHWSADVTPNHRWWSDTRVVRAPETLTACPECGWTGRTDPAGRNVTPTPRSISTHRGRAHQMRNVPLITYSGEFVTTDALRGDHRLRVAAVADTPPLLDLTPDEAALIAWMIGDGSRDPWGAILLYQSKPTGVAEIQRLLANIPHSDYTRQRAAHHLPAHTFRVRATYGRDLLARARLDELGHERFVLALSREQRRAYLAAMIAAEGATGDNFTRIAQVNGPVQDAIKLAVYLEGYRPTFVENSAERNGYQPAGCVGMARPHVAPGMFHPPAMLDRQSVWCVTTELGTWTCEQNGLPFLTGNSTFNAYHQPGTSSNIYDPVANIAAAINYIKSRYGSIFAIDPPVQGYRNGGMVDRTGFAFLHAGEEVLTSQAAGHRGSGVVVAPGAITVYAARGQDERQIAAQAFTMLRAWVAEEERKAAKGGRA